MSRPAAYDPQEGYRYQILCRDTGKVERMWEHCDYATDRADRKHLLNEYRLAYGAGWEFRTLELPRKYWPKPAGPVAPEVAPDPVDPSDPVDQGHFDRPADSITEGR